MAPSSLRRKGQAIGGKILVHEVIRTPFAFAFRWPLLTAIIIALSARTGLFVYASLWPITNEIGMAVSPTLIQPWIEFEFYERSLQMYRSMSPGELLRIFYNYYARPLTEANIMGGPVFPGNIPPAGHIIGGPVFPALIAIFDYRSGHTFPLAFAYLVGSTFVSGMWLWWLSSRNISPAWLWIFAMVPNPLWFMLNITTDLPFALLVALFYFAYFRDRWSAGGVVAWATLLILCVLTRPNGGSILLFVFLDFAFRIRMPLATRALVVGIIGLGGLVAGAYLLPYFLNEIHKVVDFRYFGVEESQYLAGLFGGLPYWIDIPLSWLALFGAKLMYLVGLRPSDAGITSSLLVMRAAIGVILLPGLMFVTFRGTGRDKLFVWIYLLPVILGPTQDRYNLAIQPLLFYYGLVFFLLVKSRLQILVGARAPERPLGRF